MKAMVCTRIGSPDVLHLEEVDKPVPKDNEVLIRGEVEYETKRGVASTLHHALIRKIKGGDCIVYTSLSQSEKSNANEGGAK